MKSREFRYLRSCKFTVHKMDKVFNHVKGCPICRSKTQFFVTDFELDKWGWYATGIDVCCTAMPDFDNEMEFDDWEALHYNMPYVDWLPYEMKLIRWLNRRIRFLSSNKNYRNARKKNQQTYQTKRRPQ